MYISITCIYIADESTQTAHINFKNAFKKEKDNYFQVWFALKVGNGYSFNRKKKLLSRMDYTNKF